MKVFLIRHGQSMLNGRGIHQSPDTGLSERGIRQAEAMAERFVGVKVDLILASRYRRAMHTAQIISRRIDRRVVYTKLLNEFKNPTEVEGLRHGSAKAMKIAKMIRAHAHDPKWHYSDEENMFDKITRGKKAVKYIEDMHADSVIVATHSGLLRMILAIGIFGKELTPEDFAKIVSFMMTENTGITECEVTGGRWRLITFNDFVHLK